MTDLTFEGRWHPYPKEKPAGDSEYLITVKNPKYYYIFVDKDLYNRSGTWPLYRGDDEKCIVAWAELPTPYDQRRKIR